MNYKYEDIKPEWFNVIRRLQSLAGRQNGCAIITMSVLVNQEGLPVFWTEPKMQKIEPARSSTKFLAQIISGFKE